MGLNNSLGAYARTLYIGGLAIGMPPTGSVAANGALTLGGALRRIYGATTTGGVYLYFIAGAVYSGSAAGFYYCTMNTSTVGTIFNNVYTSGVPTIPASPTPIVAAGPGAYTQTTTEITALSLPLSGGSLGDNGRIDVDYGGVITNSVTAKWYRLKLGSYTYSTYSPTSVASNVTHGFFQNRAGQSRQFGAATNTSSGFGAVVISDGAIDTSVDSTLTMTLQLGADTEFMIVEAYRFVQS